MLAGAPKKEMFLLASRTRLFFPKKSCRPLVASKNFTLKKSHKKKQKKIADHAKKNPVFFGAAATLEDSECRVPLPPGGKGTKEPQKRPIEGRFRPKNGLYLRQHSRRQAQHLSSLPNWLTARVSCGSSRRMRLSYRRAPQKWHLRLGSSLCTIRLEVVAMPKFYTHPGVCTSRFVHTGQCAH